MALNDNSNKNISHDKSQEKLSKKTKATVKHRLGFDSCQSLTLKMDVW